MESPLSTGPSVEETNENSLEPAGKTRDHSVSEPSRLRQLQSLLDQVYRFKSNYLPSWTNSGFTVK